MPDSTSNSASIPAFAILRKKFRAQLAETSTNPMEEAGGHNYGVTTSNTSARGDWLSFVSPAVFCAATARPERQPEDSHHFSPACFFSEVSLSVTQSTEAESRVVIRSLFEKLSDLDEDLLDYGDRMHVMSSILGEAISSHEEMFCDSLRRVLCAGPNYISDAAKSAAIRYLGIYDTPLQLNELTGLFVQSLSSPSEAASIAAARSLSETADVGAIPAIRLALQSATAPSVRAEIESAIKQIEGAHGAGPSS